MMYGGKTLWKLPQNHPILYVEGEGCLGGGIWVWGMSHTLNLLDLPATIARFVLMNLMVCFCMICFQNVNTFRLENELVLGLR